VYARVSTYDVEPERIDDSVRSFREAIEAIRALDGFHEAFLLVDRENGQAVTITLWDGPGSMVASRVRASRARTDAARAADGAVKSTCEYEIALHETGA
jgi:heme-degrading monooxygenase HmoA